MGPSVPGSHAYMGILCSPCRPPARPTICQELKISNNQIHSIYHYIAYIPYIGVTFWILTKNVYCCLLRCLPPWITSGAKKTLHETPLHHDINLVIVRL